MHFVQAGNFDQIWSRCTLRVRARARNQAQRGRHSLKAARRRETVAKRNEPRPTNLTQSLARVRSLLSC